MSLVIRPILTGWKSFKEIDKRADFVLPGHEPAIVEKNIYP